jgi:hypothetical protein
VKRGHLHPLVKVKERELEDQGVAREKLLPPLRQLHRITKGLIFIFTENHRGFAVHVSFISNMKNNLMQNIGINLVVFS